MAEAEKILAKVSKNAAADTSEQHTAFDKILGKIKKLAEKLGQVFSLSEKDREKYNGALRAKRAVIPEEVIGPEARPTPE